MLRTTLLSAIALAAAAPGWAQSNCRPNTPDIVSTAEYAEARRPVIAQRKLTNEEKAAAKKLVSDIRSAIKDKNRNVNLADLEALAPYGATGDREIMKTLMEGYTDLRYDAIKVTDVPDYSIGTPNQILAGLWGMQVYLAGDRSKEMARAVAPCLGTVRTYYSPMTADGTCGYDIEVNEADYYIGFEPFAIGKGRLAKQVKFKEETLIVPFDTEKYRFERALADYRSGGDRDKDKRWAECWAKRQGGEYQAVWENSDDVHYKAYQQEQIDKVTRAKNERDQKSKEWNALLSKRIEAKAQGGKLADADEGKWISLSFWLGGKYLEPYASEAYLGQQTAIDSLCSDKPGVVCDRQRRIWQTLFEQARSEANMKDAIWRNAVADNAPGSTSVRTYDQNGNYQGTSTMPKWQADILKGN